MKKALILGCSHAAGSEMNTESDVDLLNYGKERYGYFMSYPVQLAQLLGYHAMNHAIPGGSNDAIFRIFETYCNPYKERVKPDVVIACWTGGERTEIWDYEEGEWIGLAGGKINFSKVIPDKIMLEGQATGEPVDNHNDIVAYQKQWITHHADRWWGRMNKLKNILALNTMASQIGIPVINLDSFGAVQEYNFPDSVYRPLGQTEFCNWAVERGFNNTKSGHYFLSAHKSFANFIAKKVDPKYHADNIGKIIAE
jgi:hypothetical protein